MTHPGYAPTPQFGSYDVIIIGGAMMGASVAWFLSDNPDFDGRILVIERDPGFGTSSTMHSNSCIRQQFSAALNVRISQFGATFVQDLRAQMGGDPRIPDLAIQNFGYLYLADTEAGAAKLRRNLAVQQVEGAGTRLLEPDAIAEAYPFYALDDICLGSLNTRDEGYFDGGTLFDWWRRKARENGVESLMGEVAAMQMSRDGTRITSVSLMDGTRIGCGHVVNATGPRAARTAAMAGLDLPVEPRKRYTWVFSAERPLDRALPLTVDPSGVHVRQDGPASYMAGSKGFSDDNVGFDDFAMEPELWQEVAWPAIARRIPQFEAVRVVREWAGHYAMNLFDQNAIVGPAPGVDNFLFINGFSGHGLQQSPAMGRGVSEWITYGGYRTLDLSPLHYDRVLAQNSLTEQAVI